MCKVCQHCSTVLGTFRPVHACEPSDSRMIQKPNAHVWTELQTCAAPSANSSHTICRELKFVGFLREHKRELGAPCVLYLPQVHGRFIYDVPSANRLRTAGSHVCTSLYNLECYSMDW